MTSVKLMGDSSHNLDQSSNSSMSATSVRIIAKSRKGKKTNKISKNRELLRQKCRFEVFTSSFRRELKRDLKMMK